MAKDPAFLFYTSDFILGTSLMSHEDTGKYITILCYMHQKGRLSEDGIKKLLRCSVSPDLKGKFKIDENGLWYNERLEQEIARRKRFTEACRNNGKLSTKHRANNDTKPDESFEKFWKLYDKPTEKQNCIAKWNKLSDSERELIFEKLPVYVEATPERQFRKNPLTYLTRKIWLDELIPEPPKAAKKSAFELLVETGKYE